MNGVFLDTVGMIAVWDDTDQWQVPDEDSDEEDAGHEDTPASQSGHA